MQRWDKGLYLVPTPIGNLADMSNRAVDVLSNVDVVFCEDTRTTKKLCAYYGVNTKLRPYHDHSDDHTRGQIVDLLKEGRLVALVSDAGTPMISDPGYKLVRDCIAQDIKIIPLPGANAVLPALQIAGFPTDRFFFGGFLPQKAGERLTLLSEHLASDMMGTLCYYESPKRILKTVQAICEIDAARPVCVVREISKLHEEAIRGTAQDVADDLAARDQVKGEIVLVIKSREEGQTRSDQQNKDVVRIVQSLLETMSLRDAAAVLSNVLPMSKKDIYDLGIAIKNGEIDAE